MTKAWESYTREVNPIRKKRLKLRASQNMADKAAARSAASTEPVELTKISVSRSLDRDVFKSLERNREKSLRLGDIVIDAKLDLHGMTRVEAFETLVNFMHKKTKAGKRTYLIITGKGRGGEGVLRRNLESWISQLPEAKSVLALRPGAPKHGGEGAFYVVMRKRRPTD